jgi:hypothetical protein
MLDTTQDGWFVALELSAYPTYRNIRQRTLASSPMGAARLMGTLSIRDQQVAFGTAALTLLAYFEDRE